MRNRTFALLAFTTLFGSASIAQAQLCPDGSNEFSRLEAASQQIHQKVVADDAKALSRWPASQELLHASESPEAAAGAGATQSLMAALDIWSQLRTSAGDLYYGWSLQQINRTVFSKDKKAQLLATMDPATGEMTIYPGFFKLSLMEQISTIFHEASHRGSPYDLGHRDCTTTKVMRHVRDGCDPAFTGNFGGGSYNAEFQLFKKVILDSDAPEWLRKQARTLAGELLNERFNVITAQQKSYWRETLAL